MNIAHAQSVLEIASLDGISASELKRAYLRKVKVHDPERDPENFVKVREAYDFLQVFVKRGAAVDDAPLPNGAAPTASIPPTAAAAFAAPSAPVDPLALFRERWGALSEDDKSGLGILAREALAAVPNNEEAMWWLHEALADINAHEAWKVLNDGVAAGHRSFRLALARQSPALVSDEILQSLLSHATPSEQILLAHVGIAQKRYDGVAGILAKAALDEQDRGGDPLFLVPSAMEVLLALYEAHQEEEAIACKQVVRRLYGAEDHALAKVGHVWTIYMAVLDELEAMGAELETNAKVAVAGACRSGEFEGARVCLEMMLQARARDDAFILTFFTKAPTLVTLLSLIPPSKNAPSLQRPWWHVSLSPWQVAIFSFWFLRCMYRNIDCDSHQPTSNSDRPSLYGRPSAAPDDVSSVMELTRVCLGNAHPVCKDAFNILAFAQAGQCLEVMRMALPLQNTSMDLPTNFKQPVRAVAAMSVSLCARQPKP